MKITEQNFIIQLKNRNERALEYVISEYGWIIKTVVNKHLYLLPNLNEECMNDVLLAVWNHIESYDSERSTFQNWIAGIARYKAIDFIRKYERYLKEESLDMVEEVSDSKLNTDILEEAISEEMEKMLSCLPEKDRILFQRLFVEEEPIESVAKDMDLDKSVIYNHISRSRKKLKKLYPKLRREQM